MKKLVLIKKETEEEKREIEIKEEDIIEPTDRAERFDRRAGGEFSGKGWYLPMGYNWVVGKDSVSNSVLLRLKEK